MTRLLARRWMGNMARTAPSPSLAGIPVFAVVDENRARAAAGITMAVGAVAFAEANFEHHFVPIRIVTIVFAVDFLLRVTVGLDRSPVGVVSTWIARRRPPEPVSARPKRFAWTLGSRHVGRDGRDHQPRRARRAAADDLPACASR